ncbi:MAG TPA: hypothetical protein VE931_01660 [Pyrinomonadaceae bacterium]|nr:hypothetical protein [Pyrinomonadaceae bacterium]
MLLSFNSAVAKPWRGIEPLHSTRADVERLLGRPIDDKTPYTWKYEFPEERAMINFLSGAPCEEGLPGGWKVPKDTVRDIVVYPSAPTTISTLLPAWKEYEQVPTPHIQNAFYIDIDDGVRVSVTDEWVKYVFYGPTAKDKDYRCGEYKYAAPIVPGVRLRDFGDMKFDAFGDIRFIDAQARLNNFASQVVSMRGSGYIIVYAGRRSYKGEAQFKANCYKNYLVRVRKMDAGRVFAVDGGFRERFEVDLYVGSADEYPPMLEPTVSPKKAQVINRRLKSCSERSLQ